jgi:hypothetical protein
MKHGYVILSRDEMLGEISFGSYPTLTEAKRGYKYLKSSANVGVFEKKHLRLVELVEREIVIQ